MHVTRSSAAVLAAVLPLSLALAGELAGARQSPARGLSATQAAARPAYTVAQIPLLPGGAGAINNHGQVVGSLKRGADDSQAAIWRNGRTTELGTLGGASSQATAINDRGHVVGTSGTSRSSQAVHAFIWGDGRMRDLGDPFDRGFMEARALNNRDEAVGVGEEAAGELGLSTEDRAWLWRTGRASSIGLMRGYSEGGATGINSRGQVIGIAQSPTSETNLSRRRGWVWQRGVFRDLGMLAGGHWCTAEDINDAGQVVGAAQVGSAPEAATERDNTPRGRISPGGASPVLHAILWSGGRLRDLGALPGDGFSMARAINNSGDVVGVSARDSQGQGARAVLWRAGRALDLNALIGSASGWTLAQAQAINDRGQIVGRGTHNGKPASFLLTPVGSRTTAP